MNFSHYLPNTEERIERLRRLINKRPVAITLLGYSITELEARITELEDCDICYFAVNAFGVIEKHILQKINRTISLVMSSAAPGKQMDDIVDFLERPEDNMLFSEWDAFHPQEGSIHPQEMPLGFDYDEFVKKYDKKLLFFTGTHTVPMTRSGLFLIVPSIEHPLHFPKGSSFQMLLVLALIGEASRVVIFGGDGGRINTREFYFRESDEKHFHNRHTKWAMEQSIMHDTRLFNMMWSPLIERINKIYGLKPIDIVNCSPQSHFTPLRKLSYDETFALLRGK